MLWIIQLFAHRAIGLLGAKSFLAHSVLQVLRAPVLLNQQHVLLALTLWLAQALARIAPLATVVPLIQLHLPHAILDSTVWD